MKMDKDSNGYIDKEEFMAIPGIKGNPLASRVIELFDQNGDGSIDFQEFILGLSSFSAKGNKEEKLQCKVHPHHSSLSIHL